MTVTDICQQPMTRSGPSCYCLVYEWSYSKCFVCAFLHPRGNEKRGTFRDRSGCRLGQRVQSLTLLGRSITPPPVWLVLKPRPWAGSWPTAYLWLVAPRWWACRATLEEPRSKLPGAAVSITRAVDLEVSRAVRRLVGKPRKPECPPLGSSKCQWRGLRAPWGEDGWRPQGCEGSGVKALDQGLAFTPTYSCSSGTLRFRRGPSGDGTWVQTLS